MFRIVADTVAEFDGLHTHVNNASVAQVKPLLEVEPAELEQLFRVNVFGVVYGRRS